ncbi:MAG: WYL domain-containing protein, partial [Clostridium sp.]|nr:WYL domain-containing protein [Clostridium sp.]
TLPEFRIENEAVFPAQLKVKALFDPSMKWRLIEEYGIDSFQVQPDGMLLFQFGFMDQESVFGWLLSFGDRAQLLEPAGLRRKMQEMLGRMAEKYRD